MRNPLTSMGAPFSFCFFSSHFFFFFVPPIAVFEGTLVHRMFNLKFLFLLFFLFDYYYF